MAKAQRFITRPRPDAGVAEFSALGTSEDIAGVIQDYIDAGASKFVLRPLCPGAETAEQLALLGQEVLPRFHRAARSSAPSLGR
jgi:hypothetical protein